jgi:hypothetical protein
MKEFFITEKEVETNRSEQILTMAGSALKNQSKAKNPDSSSFWFSKTSSSMTKANADKERIYDLQVVGKPRKTAIEFVTPEFTCDNRILLSRTQCFYSILINPTAKRTL